MPRPVSNPPNPWDAYTVEWIGPPPDAELTVLEEEAKSMLSTNESPDVPFRFSVNPYRGCTHACGYCYARRTHPYLGYGAGTDFDRVIVVKTNAPDVLARELARPSWKREQVVFSGNTDCYQPLEARYELTRRCLEACRRFETPVGVITKGVLVRRDAELLADLAAGPGAEAHVSVAFTDADASRRMEPGCPTPAERFETIRILAAAGVPTSVAVSPVIPGLNDSAVPGVLERAAEAGAQRAFLTLLRLPGEVRPVFEERLREGFPGRASKVLSTLAGLRAKQAGAGDFGERMRGGGPRWEAITRMFEVACRRFGLDAQGSPTPSPLPTTPDPVQGSLFDA